MFDFLSRLAGSLVHRKQTPRRRPTHYRRLDVEALGARQLLSLPAYVAPIHYDGPLEVAPLGDRDVDQQMGLPMLNSLPAPVTLYLDFTGNFLSSWDSGDDVYSNVSTPVWDTDGNAANYSTAEQAIIREVWAQVAEDFAPFNINVSTDYYGGFENGQALRVAIGGQPEDWLGLSASGIANIGSFQSSEPNVVFAFDMVAWANDGVQDHEGRTMHGPTAMATTISHEAGHAFGLRHHSVYFANGDVADWYDKGSSNWTPIMGNNLSNDRTTWAFLPTDESANVWQDDMAVLATGNGFGFRADDHGNTTAAATWMTSSGPIYSVMTSFVGKGIINQPNDKDFFKFTAPGGAIKIEVNAAQFGPNLLPVLQLWSSSGLMASANYVTPTKSIINANLTAGTTYYVLVKSVGFYGDVGQYTLTVKGQMKAVLQTATTGGAALPTYQTSDTTSTSYLSSRAGVGKDQGTTFVTAGPLSGPTMPMFLVDVTSLSPAELKSLNGSTPRTVGSPKSLMNDVFHDLGLSQRLA